MSNITGVGYVNRAKFTPGEKARLNISLSETVGKGDNKTYLNYEFTLWETEAVYYHSILGEEPKNVVATFSGYITAITANPSKDGSKIYTSIRVNLNKQFNNSAFNLLPDLRNESSGNSSNNLAEDDF
jgi:hypothetical protein